MNNSIPVDDRARRYLAKVPPAKSSQRGHDQTFKAACNLVHGFDLSESDALLILSEWNQRCEPAWSESELLHKIRGAAKAPSVKPRGYLLRNKPNTQNLKPINGKSNRPNLTGFRKGTATQIELLATARPYGLEGLNWANERGVLVFGEWNNQQCYGLTDRSGHALEIRLVSQESFPEYKTLSERKSHAIRGSKKAWPIGILEAASVDTIILLEGIPDFLEAHNLILNESRARPELKRSVAPVAMLSSSPLIHKDALPFFKDKRVRIFPHLDQAGLNGARKWKIQLDKIPCLKVDFYSLSGLNCPDGQTVEDLWDMRQCEIQTRMIP